MNWLLTEDEIDDVLQIGGTSRDYLRAVARAQLKKMAEKENCWASLNLEHPEYYKNQDFIVMPTKYYLEMLKEAQGET